MSEYYVVRDKNTGLYFRGKGVNRWGKYYNQASIYRVRKNAENTIKEVSWRGEQAEVIPIRITEATADVVEVRHGNWIWKFNLDGDDFYECSICDRQEVINGLCREKKPAEHFPYCHCGAKMDGERRTN